MATYAGFHEYVAARGPALSRTAFLLTGDHEEAEDLVQEALSRVVRHWNRVLAGGDPEAYIRKTMLNSLRSSSRRRIRTVPICSVPDPAQPSDQERGADSRLALKAMLAVLGPRQRAVLYLRYFEDLPEREVARLLGCSIGTVKRHNHDALTTLRRLAPSLLDLDNQQEVSS